MSPFRRIPVALSVIGVICAGCGASTSSTPPKTSRSGATTCAPPYVFELQHRSITAGSCAGVIVAPKRTLPLAVGQELRVTILRDEATPGAGFPVPTPSAAILKVIAHRPGSADYRAVQRGSARLVVRSRFCGAGSDRLRRCVVLRVRVR